MSEAMNEKETLDRLAELVGREPLIKAGKRAAKGRVEDAAQKLFSTLESVAWRAENADPSRLLARARAACAEIQMAADNLNDALLVQSAIESLNSVEAAS